MQVQRPPQLIWSNLAAGERGRGEVGAFPGSLMSSTKYIPDLTNVGAGLCAARVNAAALHSTRRHYDSGPHGIFTEPSEDGLRLHFTKLWGTHMNIIIIPYASWGTPLSRGEKQLERRWLKGESLRSSAGLPVCLRIRQSSNASQRQGKMR